MRKAADDERGMFFTSPSIGLIFGDLSGAKEDDKGSGLTSPLGINIGLLLGWCFGIGRTVGLIFTPGVAVGSMGFIVISIGVHYKQMLGLGIVIPIWKIW